MFKLKFGGTFNFSTKFCCLNICTCVYLICVNIDIDMKLHDMDTDGVDVKHI